MDADPAGLVAAASSVRVGAGRFVFAGRVGVGLGVHVGEGVGIIVGGKIWFATGRPKMAEATVNANRTKEIPNHCQPAAMRARRVR